MPSPKPLTIIFDIDNVLAVHKPFLERKDKLYFLRRGAVITAAGCEHEVFPGVIELMKYLFSKNNIIVAFFSSGSKERNDDFVSKLLILSLGQEKYDQISSGVRVLNSDDLTPTDEAEDRFAVRIFGMYSGKYKKDIMKALNDSVTLDYAILIDNDRSVVRYGQEKNYLRSPCAAPDGLHWVRKSYEDKIEYSESGFENYFYELNSIFYVAGVLAECIQLHESGKSIADFLFDLHFKKKKNELFRFEPRRYLGDKHCRIGKHFHNAGLQLLQKINPNLCFVTPEDIISVISSERTEAEQSFLDEHGAVTRCFY